MSRTSLQSFHCSLARTVDIIGDKWTLLVLRDAFFGSTTFSQFHKSLGMARNILSDRLDKLVEHGILEKKPTKPGVERYTYHLTSRGHELVPVLISITQWGDKWVFGEGAEPLKFVDKENREPIRKMGVQAQDGRSLSAEDILPSFISASAYQSKVSGNLSNAKSKRRH